MGAFALPGGDGRLSNLKEERMKVLKILAPVLIVLLAVSCAQPPKAEIDAAKAALADAQTAEASVYAPDSYAKAEAAVAAVDSSVAAKKYKEAKTQAVEAKTLAETAKTDAATAKDQAKADVTALVAELQQASQALAQLADQAQKTKGIKFDFVGFKTQMDAGQQAFAAIQASVDGGKYLDAKTAATALKDQIAQATTALQAAIDAAKKPVAKTTSTKKK